jgi:predicted component of type VI protein secretion system
VTELTFVEQKPMEGREQTLSAGSTIGREGCDVNLMDPEVSRRHATIREGNGGSLAIEDLGSTNGTYVNGTRITAVTALSDGDTVRLGNTVWSIRGAAPADAGAGAGATTVGQVQSGAPQVTAARAVPSDIDVPSSPPAAPAAQQPTTAQQVPADPQATTARQVPAAPAPPAAPAAAAAAAPQQPAQPAPPSAAPVGRRGDVEAPPEVAPSAIRRVLPPPAAGQAPAFQAPGARPGGSAATRVEATVVCMIIALAVAVVLAIYFITY